MNHDPNQDPDKDRMPLTIVGLKGEYDHWTDHWGVICENLDLPLHAQINLDDDNNPLLNLTGWFEVVGREIITEVEMVSSNCYRDMVRLFIVQRIGGQNGPPKGVVPFTSNWQTSF